LTQQIATTERNPMNSVAMSSGPGGSSIAPQSLGDVVRFAEVMCRADIALPQHLRGNAGACMAVAMQALEWQMSPFAVASKSYSVGGRIAYEAQLIAAVVNTRSGIKGRLKYEFEGEGPTLTCRVVGVLDGEECEYKSPPVGSITTKNSPLWKSDPQQQLGYFSARSWARRHCPEVILGVYDREEVEQLRSSETAKDVTPLSERLAMAKIEQHEPAGAQEGFDRSFVARETSEATSEPAIEQEPSSPAVPPVDDAGSGDSSPPVPAADQSSSSQAADPADGNSGDEPEKPSADEVAMVNSAKSNVQGIKSDMVKMLVRLAGENLTAQERLENLDGAYPLWVERIPGHPTLVKQCFDTASKIIKGELPAAKAKQFMESLL
jgi:hypothetical protein